MLKYLGSFFAPPTINHQTRNITNTSLNTSKSIDNPLELIEQQKLVIKTMQDQIQQFLHEKQQMKVQIEKLQAKLVGGKSTK
jgi:cell division septum initiation protein DivIVA